MVKRWFYVLAFCIVGVPLLSYWVGTLIMGPYEGERGVLGMMAGIYADALTGHLNAWILLFSPLLLVGIWLFCLQLRRMIPR